MNTETRLTRVVASAAMAVAFFFTGCGGGDNNTSDIVAPGTLAGHSYNLQQTGDGATAVSFNSASDYTFQHTNGNIESGTYTATQNGNTWTATLFTDGGGQQIYGLAFASSSGGSYTRHLEGEADVSGTFTARSDAISNGSVDPSQNPVTGGAGAGDTTNGGLIQTDPGSTNGGNTSGSTGGSTTTPGGGTSAGSTNGATTGTTNGSATGNTNGGTVTPSSDYNGFAPVSIAGRTMSGTRTFTSTGPSGQTHVYTFGNGTFHDSDSPEESGGTFTYTASNSAATLDLQYTSPATFVGDSHHLTMTFSGKDQGTFQSTYNRGDGTTIVINGNFQIDSIQ